MCAIDSDVLLRLDRSHSDAAVDDAAVIDAQTCGADITLHYPGAGDAETAARGHVAGHVATHCDVAAVETCAHRRGSFDVDVTRRGDLPIRGAFDVEVALDGERPVEDVTRSQCHPLGARGAVSVTAPWN